MNIDTNTDLIKFINNEKKKSCDFNFFKVYNFFTKCFIKTLIKINEKLKNIDNLKNNTVNGCDVMFNVFWIILLYSNNITLTIFLSERSILLFTEFVIMAYNPKINKELFYTPNIIDAMNFSYKKTIGPINSYQIKSKQSKFKNNSLTIFKIIMIYIYLNIDDIDNINIFYNYLNNSIVKIYKLLNIDKLYFLIFDKINSLLSNKNNTVHQNIYLLKILFEKLNKIKNLEINDIYTITNKIFNIFDEHNLEDTFDINFKNKNKNRNKNNIEKKIKELNL